MMMMMMMMMMMTFSRPVLSQFMFFLGGDRADVSGIEDTFSLMFPLALHGSNAYDGGAPLKESVTIAFNFIYAFIGGAYAILAPE
jgi:hypothetical protein